MHQKDLPGKPDIVLPRWRTVIFVHGCFWHGHPGCKRSALPAANHVYWKQKIGKNIERDKRHSRKLRGSGWHVLTVWECAVKDERMLRRRILSPLRKLDLDNDA